MEEYKSSSVPSSERAPSANPRVRFAETEGPLSRLPDATDSFHEEPEIHDSTFSLKSIKDEQEKERMSAEAIDGELFMSSKMSGGSAVEFTNPMFRSTPKNAAATDNDAEGRNDNNQGTESSESAAGPAGSDEQRHVQTAAPSHSHADHAKALDVLTQNPLRVLGISKFQARHDFLAPPAHEPVDAYGDELATEYVRRVLEGAPQIDLDIAPRSIFSKHLRDSSGTLAVKAGDSQQRKSATTGPTSTLQHHMSSQTDETTDGDEEERVAAHSLCTLLDLHDRLMRWVCSSLMAITASLQYGKLVPDFFVSPSLGSEKTDLEKLPGKIRTMEGNQLALIASERANLQAREESVDSAKLEFQRDHANCLAELLQLARTIQSRQGKFRSEEARLENMEKELNRLNDEAQSHLAFIEKSASAAGSLGGMMANFRSETRAVPGT